MRCSHQINCRGKLDKLLYKAKELHRLQNIDIIEFMSINLP